MAITLKKILVLILLLPALVTAQVTNVSNIERVSNKFTAIAAPGGAGFQLLEGALYGYNSDGSNTVYTKYDGSDFVLSLPSNKGFRFKVNSVDKFVLDSTGVITTGIWGGAAIPATKGGTGVDLSAGVSGGIVGFTSTGVLASSAPLTANRIVIGGGAGATPTILGSLGTTTTLLHGNASGAPTFGAVDLANDVTGTLGVARGGLGIGSGTSGGVLGFTGVGGLASSVELTAGALVLGGGAGATPTPMASLGTTTTVLHGNAGGAPTYRSVSLTSDVTGVLPTANGGVPVITGTIVYDFAGIAVGCAVSSAVTVIGAALGDRCLLGINIDMSAINGIFSCEFTGANLAVIKFCGLDVTSNPGNATFTVQAIH